MEYPACSTMTTNTLALGQRGVLLWLPAWAQPPVKPLAIQSWSRPLGRTNVLDVVFVLSLGNEAFAQERARVLPAYYGR